MNGKAEEKLKSLVGSEENARKSFVINLIIIIPCRFFILILVDFAHFHIFNCIKWFINAVVLLNMFI